MSGKIELVVRKAKSKSPYYTYYPEWIWKVTDEDGKTTVTVSPPYHLLSKIFRDIIIHEYRVDRTIIRKPDERKWRKFFLKEMPKIVEESQRRVNDANIPKIYSPPMTTLGKKRFMEDPDE